MSHRPAARRTAATLPACLLLATLLGACGGSDDETGPAAATPTSVTELVAEDDATRAVTDAIAELRTTTTGTFEATYLYDDDTFAYTGVYRLSPPEQRLTVTTDTGDGDTVESEVVSDAGLYYARLPAEGGISSDCWVRGDLALVGEAVGVEQNPAFQTLPGVLVLASTAVGVADDPARPGGVLGTVDLATAVSLISPRLPALLGLAGDERVVARFDISEDALSDIQVEGPALLAAFAENGIGVDGVDLADLFGADVPIDVRLANPGSRVVIETPDPAVVIDLADADANQRLAACTA